LTVELTTLCRYLQYVKQLSCEREIWHCLIGHYDAAVSHHKCELQMFTLLCYLLRDEPSRWLILCVPGMSPSSIIWYRPRRWYLCGWESGLVENNGSLLLGIWL